MINAASHKLQFFSHTKSNFWICKQKKLLSLLSLTSLFLSAVSIKHFTDFYLELFVTELFSFLFFRWARSAQTKLVFIVRLYASYWYCCLTCTFQFNLKQRNRKRWKRIRIFVESARKSFCRVLHSAFTPCLVSNQLKFLGKLWQRHRGKSFLSLSYPWFPLSFALSSNVDLPFSLSQCVVLLFKDLINSLQWFEFVNVYEWLPDV